MERLDWNDGKRVVEYEIEYQKNRIWAAIFFYQLCLDADVTGN